MSEDITRRSTGRRTADAVVTYEVRDVLDRIEQGQISGFGELKQAIERKADRDDVAEVKLTVRDHEQRIAATERWQRDEDTRRADQAGRAARITARWWPFGLAVLTFVGSILAIFIPH